MQATEVQSREELLTELTVLRERVRALEALVGNPPPAAEEEEARYRSLIDDVIESSTIGLFILDADFRVVWMNRALENFFGLDRREVIGQDKRRLILERFKYLFADPEEYARQILASYQAQYYGEHFECHLLPDDTRQERWLEYWCQPIRSGVYRGGRIEHFTDITERKRAEETFKNLIMRAPIGIFIIQAGNFTLVNPGFLHITGYREEELLGRNSLSRVVPEFKDEVRKNAIRMLQGKSSLPFEFQVFNRAGEVRWIMESLTPISYGGEQAILGFFMDITERRELEGQFLQAQKMEAIGRLAGGVAHDFNNLLTAISGYAEMLLLDVRQDPPGAHNIQEIIKATERGASLTRQLLAFSRKQILQPRLVNFNDVVADMDRMLARLIGEDIELVTLCDPALQMIKADPGQVEQVILNLAVNARDAMPQGGRLLVETANVHLDEAYAVRHLEVTPGRYVMLAVTDSGVGIDPETLEHIFEPFFTTKSSGKGTGLGLSTVYGIVKQSGGHIWVYSEVGQGTTFKIYLPVAETAEQPSIPETPAEKPGKGWETILLVEDDEDLRTFIQQALSQYGYEVLSAAHGQEALEVSRNYPHVIHLLLTDVVMPQMGGYELEARLTATRPALKVLYMSGYTGNSPLLREAQSRGHAFVQKPFKVAALAAKVREILDASVSTLQ